MSRIRGTNTKPEKAVRAVLHAHGYRFRLHQATLPGRPDIVLRKHRIAVFVHGCFWHAHQGCTFAKLPASNTGFWRRKLAGNAKRDVENKRKLLDSGWRVLTVWECAIRGGEEPLDRLASRLLTWIASRHKHGEIPQTGARGPRRRSAPS